VIAGQTRLVGLIGRHISESRSPRMQNAAFAARGLDWAYVPLEVEPDGLEEALRGLVALGFAGANVTAPYKLAVAELVRADIPSVNTLLVRGGALQGSTTDPVILEQVRSERPVLIGDGGAAHAFRHALPNARVFSRAGDWPPSSGEADLVVNATPVRDEILVELGPDQTLVDLPYPESATAAAARAAGARVLDGLEVLVAQGAASFELWTGVPAPVEVMRRAIEAPTR
jgi:shikimate dehydrogenase